MSARTNQDNVRQTRRTSPLRPHDRMPDHSEVIVFQGESKVNRNMVAQSKILYENLIRRNDILELRHAKSIQRIHTDTDEVNVCGGSINSYMENILW